MEHKLTDEILLSEFEADNQVVSPCLDTCQNSNVWPYCQNILFKTFSMEEETVEDVESTTIIFDTTDNFEPISNFNTTKGDYSKKESVTHIEIIKSTTLAPRRVTGISRVVPSITSAWQRTNFKASEPSITEMYTKFMAVQDTGLDTECQECLQQFLSSIEVELHVRFYHPEVTVTADYCFVCRKKFVFESQLKNHLSIHHGIQFPDMICKICFMELNTPLEMKAHERKHSKEFNCQYCTQKFASECTYQKHFDDHMLILKPYECKTCGKRFFNSITHDVHTNRHVKLSCMLCDLLFIKELLYLEHIKSHAPEAVEHLLNKTALLDLEEDNLDSMIETYRKEWQKHLPKNTTTSISLGIDQASTENLEESVNSCMQDLLVAVVSSSPIIASPLNKSALGKLELDCKLCRLRVSSANDLVDHQKTSHARSRTCPFCRRLSASFSQLQKHMGTHLKTDRSTPPTKPCLTCNFCSKTFKNKSKWNNHLESVHKMNVASRPFSCANCSRNFINKSSRDKHMLSVHSEEKTVKTCVRCEICNQAFVRPKFLTKHMQTVHETVHSCSECNKTFRTKDKLKKHEENHKPVSVRQKHKCTFCSVCCSTLSGLRVHLRIHTNERPYDCDLCEKNFKRPQALKKHKLLLHTTVESISRACPDCPLKFNDRGNLMRHFLRLHKGLRRFICGFCGDRYGQNQDLRRHLKMKHDAEIPNIKGSNKKSIHEIYVLPALESSDILQDVAEKIKIAVGEESLKLVGVSERFSTNPGDKLENTNKDFTSQRIQNDPKTKASEIREPEGSLLCSLKHFPSEAVSETAKIDPSVAGYSCSTLADATNYQLLYNSLGVDTQIYILNPQVEDNPSINAISSLDQCDLCQTFFCVPSHYEEHVLKRKENSCQLCSESFCDAASLQSHISSTHKKLPNLQMLDICYRCGICQVDFTKKESLTEHMQDVHDVTVQFDISPEDICTSVSHQAVKRNNLNCSLEDNLMLDVIDSTQIDGIGEQSANLIPVTVNEVARLNSETQINAETPYLCSSFSTSLPNSSNSLPTLNPLSVFTFQTSDNITHMVANQQRDFNNLELISSEYKTDHRVSSELPVSPELAGLARPSTQCPKKVAQEVDAAETPSAPKKMTCAQCGRHFPEVGRLIRHINTHLGVKPFKCPECKKLFSEKHNLKVHLRSHTGERPYTCLMCGKKMRYQNEFADHKASHRGIKRHTCVTCGRKFPRAGQLARHALTHSGIKKHVCRICDKSFCRPDELQIHSLSHSQVRLFACEFCTKTFKTKHKLNQHKILHSGEKMHVCHVCGRTFALDFYLKSHLKIHERRGTYVACPKCPRMFSTAGHLETHLTTFHAANAKKIQLARSRNDKQVVRTLPDVQLDRTEDPPENLSEMEVTELEIQGGFLNATESGVVDDISNQMIYFNPDHGQLDPTFIFIANSST